MRPASLRNARKTGSAAGPGARRGLRAGPPQASSDPASRCRKERAQPAEIRQCLAVPCRRGPHPGCIRRCTSPCRSRRLPPFGSRQGRVAQLCSRGRLLVFGGASCTPEPRDVDAAAGIRCCGLQGAAKQLGLRSAGMRRKEVPAGGCLPSGDAQRQAWMPSSSPPSRRMRAVRHGPANAAARLSVPSRGSACLGCGACPG